MHLKDRILYGVLLLETSVHPLLATVRKDTKNPLLCFSVSHTFDCQKYHPIRTFLFWRKLKKKFCHYMQRGHGFCRNCTFTSLAMKRQCGVSAPCKEAGQVGGSWGSPSPGHGAPPWRWSQAEARPSSLTPAGPHCCCGRDTTTDTAGIPHLFIAARFLLIVTVSLLFHSGN